MTSRQLRRLGTAVMVAVLAACGDGGSPDDESTVGAGATSTTAPPAIVRTASDAALGTIVVDGEGMTLYRNAQDTAGAVTCTGDCAAVWPPLVAPNGFKPSGVLASIARPDGGSQVTYGGTPLYRYVEDKAAGETKGHGVGGIWFVVLEAGSSGQATTTTAAAAVTGAGSSTTRPTTATTTTGSRAGGTPGGGAATTAPPAAATTTQPPATAPPATSPPATAAPTTAPVTTPTTPPVTYTPTTGGDCYYPPCDP